jgi:NAD kinase
MVAIMKQRIAIRGRNLDDLRAMLTAHPVTLVDDNPDLVISHGGDGALLGAEREFPGVPKFPLRDLAHNYPCPEHDPRIMLNQALAGELKSYEVSKIQACVNDETVVGLNDICLHRQNLASAVRFRLFINDEVYANQVVGDGLVAATTFGSTGYYRSITNSIFQTGLGLAFSNTTDPIDHMVLKESCVIKLQIIRGPGIVVVDNDPKEIPVDTGDEIVLQKAAAKAIILGLNVLRCRECFRLRQKFYNLN